MLKQLLKVGVAVSTALAVFALSVSVALAISPHFISAGTASILTSGPNVGAYQVANFKEAGLGNTVSTENITLSATANATYACINGGGNHPKAANKQSVTGQVSKTGSFPVRNGSTTGTLAVGPPPAGPFSPPCSPPQTVVLVFVSYTNAMLTGVAGDTAPEPDLSACLFPGIGIC
ncbi:MAG TPA: hypothetical protein VGR57_06760 [Ktedonobacterales bacterium]|nr:hypothetical protein [Ktedonobacterales bacterium]